jgi:hypothetical protein
VDSNYSALSINQSALQEHTHELSALNKVIEGPPKLPGWEPKSKNTHLAFQVIKDIAIETQKRTTSNNQPEIQLSALWNSTRIDQARYTDGQWQVLGIF